MDKEPDWLERVRTVGKYYQSQCRDNPDYTLRDLAKDLGRSAGRLSEDLMLVSFMKTHPRVETYKNIRDAIDYCKKIKKQQKLGV